MSKFVQLLFVLLLLISVPAAIFVSVKGLAPDDVINIVGAALAVISTGTWWGSKTNDNSVESSNAKLLSKMFVVFTLLLVLLFCTIYLVELAVYRSYNISEVTLLVSAISIGVAIVIGTLVLIIRAAIDMLPEPKDNPYRDAPMQQDQAAMMGLMNFFMYLINLGMAIAFFVILAGIGLSVVSYLYESVLQLFFAS